EQGLALAGPVIVHAVTRKGAGYAPAEESPRNFHGTPPFEEETGMPRARPQTDSYSAVFGKQLLRLARQDSRIVGLTAAMLDGTGMEYLHEAMPDRCLDVGMAEQHAVTFAAGLAAAGMRPVVAIYSTFAQRAYDQWVHDVCLQNLPVVLVLDRAGLVGDDGPTHHGAFDLSYLRHIPNLTLMAPKDEAELCRMLVTALELPGPSALRFPRGAGPGVPPPEVPEALPVGRAEVLTEGEDVLVLALGAAVPRALEVCERLREEGLAATVVNARFAKPLDAELILDRAARIGRVVTVEESALAGGFGSAVVELLSDAGVEGVRVRRAGLPDRFVSHGDNARLLAECGLDAPALAETIRATAKSPGVVVSGALGRERGEGSAS
ncbi:MAG: 1-deoxy-D-xylulose-5-phosphate synthase, partial [Armatimonadetes bacterium]|nr:1-deoxy-D-xylulose-5-phosphate synthase [Armatimonadota bacterium]